MITATESSVNTAYAQIAADAEPGRIADMAERAGVESPLSPVCSLALGTSGVTPLEMARAYATLAARGVRPDVHAIRSIEGSDGEEIERHEPFRERVMDRGLADTVNAVLERVVEQGTGTPAAIDRPAAGKTGTSEEERDLWFVGYTPHPGLSTAVWVGHRDENGAVPPPVAAVVGRPATGGGFAGAIWRLFMLEALEGMEVRTFEDVMLYPPPPEGKKEKDGGDREETNDPSPTPSRDEDDKKKG